MRYGEIVWRDRRGYWVGCEGVLYWTERLYRAAFLGGMKGGWGWIWEDCVSLS